MVSDETKRKRVETTIRRHGKNIFKENGRKGGNPLLLKIRDDKIKKGAS